MEFKGQVHVCAHHVDFNYWTENDIPIDNEIEHLLEDEAESRAKEMIIEGYVCGELNCLINEKEISGWWEINRS